MTDNELIAQFMGAVKSQDYGVGGWMGYWINQGDPSATDVREMRYHQSWDWLMPVVEKIEELGFSFFIHNNGSYIRPTFYFGNFPAIGGVADNKITSTYNAVLKFIKWYSQQKV